MMSTREEVAEPDSYVVTWGQLLNGELRSAGNDSEEVMELTLVKDPAVEYNEDFDRNTFCYHGCSEEVTGPGWKSGGGQQGSVTVHVTAAYFDGKHFHKYPQTLRCLFPVRGEFDITQSPWATLPSVVLAAANTAGALWPGEEIPELNQQDTELTEDLLVWPTDGKVCNIETILEGLGSQMCEVHVVGSVPCESAPIVSSDGQPRRVSRSSTLFGLSDLSLNEPMIPSGFVIEE